jgi:hypothetical protein
MCRLLPHTGCDHEAWMPEFTFKFRAFGGAFDGRLNRGIAPATDDFNVVFDRNCVQTSEIPTGLSAFALITPNGAKWTSEPEARDLVGVTPTKSRRISDAQKSWRKTVQETVRSFEGHFVIGVEASITTWEPCACFGVVATTPRERDTSHFGAGRPIT